MSGTHWTGPIYSANGFIDTGSTANTFAGGVAVPTVKAVDGTSAMTLASSTGVVTFAAAPAAAGLKAADGTSAFTLANATGIATVVGGLAITEAKNISLGTTTGTKIGTATAQKLGFWNATPVIQPATTGTVTGYTSVGGSAVLSQSTFTGNTGSAAYTIGDVVLALKQVGILAA